MPAAASRIELNQPLPELAVADFALPIGQVAAARHLKLVENPVFHELTPDEFTVVSLLSMGKTINYMLREMPGSRRDDIVSIEGAAQVKLGVETPAALVNQAIVRGMLPINARKDPELTSLIGKPEQSAFRSYAAGRPVEKIARSLGMKLNDFIDYEPILLGKVGAKKRPASVRNSHELGILP